MNLVENGLLRWVRGQPIALSSAGFAGPVILFLAGLAAATAAGRGGIGLTPLSYSYAHETLLMASGRMRDALTQYVLWPPGYSLIAVPIVWLGVSPIRATWLISVAAFGMTVCLTFLLGRRLTSTTGGILAALLVLFNPEMLDRANIAMSEMLLAASILAALLALDAVYVARSQPDSKFYAALAVGAGLLLGWPVSVRYIGILVSLLALGVLVAMLAASPSRWRLIVGALSVTMLMLALIPLRNVLATGGVTGHPVGGLPADTFASAYSGALQGIRTLWSFFAERFRRDLVDAATALGLVGLCIWSVSRFRRLAVGSLPLVYITALCYVASHTRIDKMNDRFIMPILPVFVIALVGAVFSLIHLVQGWPSRSWHRAARWAVLALVIPLGGVGALAAARGVALVGKGYTPESDFSPQMVRHITDHVPPGTMVAANQMQLGALTLDYGFLMIPWDQPLDNWPRDYGITPWTRLEALRVFVEKDVKYVVLFFGPTNGEHVLARYNPGQYVGSSLLTEPLPEVAGVTRLSDGVLVTLADRDQLRELLSKEPPSGARPRQ